MRALIFLFPFLFINILALAKDKVVVDAEPGWLFQVTPDRSKTPSPKSVSNGYYLELIDEQVNLVNNSEYTHFIRHIVNESGVQNASEVSVIFSPEFQQVIFHKIIVIRGGETVSKLDPRQIKVVQEETDASDFQYNGIKRAFVILKDIQKGDRIEVSYSLIGFNPVFSNKYSERIYFTRGTAVCNYFKTIIAAPDRKLFIDTFNKAPKPKEIISGNVKIYHWDNPPLKDRDDESSSPSWYTHNPYVSVTEFSNWEEVIRWGLLLFDNYKYSLPESLKNKIKGWRKQANDDQDMFANLAFRFVQGQVRYLGLEMGAHTHRPHDPAEVYARRFGDCKDKALLLAMILQHENIPAYVALVNTTVRKKLVEAAPSASEFDHAIVAIQRSSGYIFVDPTMSMQRGELINLYIPAYGYALVLHEGGNKLEPVEPGFLHNTAITETLNVKYKDSTDFSVETSYSGGAADEVRDNLSSASSKDIEDTYREFYSKSFGGIQFKNPIEIADDSLKNEMNVKEFYSIPDIWQTNDKGKKYFDIYAKAVAERIPDPSSSLPGEPLALSFPRTMRYTMEINMPESWGFDVEELHIKNEFYVFDFAPTVNDSHIRLTYYFKTLKDNIPAEVISQYKTDYKKMQDKLDFELYKNGAFTPEQSSKPNSDTNKNVNWPAVWGSLIFAFLLTVLLKRLDAMRSASEYPYETGWPLGGWTIVLGITLGIGVLFQIFSVFKNQYFSNSVWSVIGKLGGSKLQYVLVVELGASVFEIMAGLGLIYWFIRRRDIFPKMFIWYVCSILSLELILVTLYGMIPYPKSFGNLQSDEWIQFFRTCIYAGVWIAYVLGSERVRNTFVER